MYGISHHQKCFRSSKYCIAARKIQLTTGGNHCCQVPALDTFSQISQKFQNAVVGSMAELTKLNRLKKRTGKEFPGEAGIYGEIGAAIDPQIDQLSATKYCENILLGKLGAEDAVRNYFLARSNPFLS